MWRTGVDPVPDDANLVSDVLPVAGPLTGEPLGVESLFQTLGALEENPIQSCKDLKEEITFAALKQHARGKVTAASLTIIARQLGLLQPE